MEYKTTLNLDESAAGKRIWLEFEAVYQNSFVYVNSAFAGKCAYGYSNFYLDITDYVKIGQPNTVKVIVKNGVPSGRWYTGGGIYRDVNLMITDPLHIAPDGVFVKTENVDDGMAEIADRTDIDYVDVSVVDQEGRLNTDEPLKVAVSVEGPGEIIGYGSAAPVSEENFYDTEAMTYEGRIRAGVRATGEGVVTVTFTAGDKTCSVKILAE